MNKSLLERYAIVKAEISKLEDEIVELQPQIILDMGDNEEVEFNGIGKFSIGKRRKWVFPADIVLAKETLKEKETEAQQLGTASYTENPYLIFSKTN